MNYTNPILPGFHPDPSVCRVGDDYYLVTSSFEYFPGVPLFHSRDLVNWTPLGHVLTRRSQLDLTQCGPSGGIYAPTIRHHRGRFYLVTTNVSGLGNFVVWTDDIRGEWSDPVKIDAPGIDPSLLFDGDRVYYTGNGGDQEPAGIYGFEVDLATGARLSDRTRFWPGTGGAYPEGPHLYHIGPWYYLMVSEGGTEHGHMVTIARSASPRGPFEPCPHNPVLTNRSRLTRAKAIGHADLVEGPDGRWWAVCLGIRPQGYPEFHILGRETFLVPVVWEDGWPVFGTEGSVALEMEVAGPGPVQVPPTFARDDFDGPALGPDWTFLRTPCAAASLAARPGYLTLTGLPASLDDQDSPAFVGRRLEHLDHRVSTWMEFSPAAEGDEAGLTVLMNNRHHYEVGLARLDGRRVVFLRRRIGSLQKVESVLPWPEGPVVLGLTGTWDRWVFTAQVPGQPVVTVGEGETRYLSTEVGGAFTGVLVGVYATGRGHRSETTAQFDWFEYQP
jgi:alpha-N-arabinofuranosidase